MKDFLSELIGRSWNPPGRIRPRLGSLFEPPPLTGPIAPGPATAAAAAPPQNKDGEDRGVRESLSLRRESPVSAPGPIPARDPALLDDSVPGEAPATSVSPQIQPAPSAQPHATVPTPHLGDRALARSSSQTAGGQLRPSDSALLSDAAFPSAEAGMDSPEWQDQFPPRGGIKGGVTKPDSSRNTPLAPLKGGINVILPQGESGENRFPKSTDMIEPFTTNHEIPAAAHSVIPAKAGIQQNYPHAKGIFRRTASPSAGEPKARENYSLGTPALDAPRIHFQARPSLDPDPGQNNQPDRISLPAGPQKAREPDSRLNEASGAPPQMESTTVSETPRSDKENAEAVTILRQTDRPAADIFPAKPEAVGGAEKQTPTPPTIRVSIGRVEIRAEIPAEPRPPAPRQPERPRPPLSLADYLRNRGRRA